jgi:hypothetical protein
LEKWTLRGENMVGIGTDGANVMCGSHHSVVTLLRRTWPHVIHLKCVCHSIDLIAKNAVKSTLPSHIDYMVRESFNWFSHSSQRLSAYREIAKLVGFSTVFEEEETTEEESEEKNQELNPPKLISPSDTRWLVLADCVEKILGQYDALKAHFQIVYTKEKCFQAKTLNEMFCDEKNFLYLLFLFPTLKELRRLSKLFQSNSVDNFRIYSELETAFKSLAHRILKPSIISSNTIECLAEINLDTDFCLLEPDSVDLGSSFLKNLEKSKLSPSEKMDLKIRGKAFLKDVFVGFQKRLCGTLTTMRKVSSFSFNNFTTSILKAEHFIAPFFPQDCSSLSEIEEKSKILKTVEFSENQTDTFWLAVHKYKGAGGNFPFHPLSNGVIKMMCLPISNAEVERVFSQVNLVKNCRRSKLKLELLESILYCKFGLSKFDRSVADFKPPVEMLKFDSTIYD